MVPVGTLERAIFSAADLLIFAWDSSVESIANAMEAVARNGAKTKAKRSLLMEYIAGVDKKCDKLVQIVELSRTLFRAKRSFRISGLSMKSGMEEKEGRRQRTAFTYRIQNEAANM